MGTFFTICQNGDLYEDNTLLALQKRLLDLRQKKIGAKVIYGVKGSFSEDGTRFKCSGDEILLNGDVPWRDSSQEWNDGDTGRKGVRDTEDVQQSNSGGNDGSAGSKTG